MSTLKKNLRWLFDKYVVACQKYEEDFFNFVALSENPNFRTICFETRMSNSKSNILQVSKSQKQFMVSSILPKHKHWGNSMYWKLFEHLFFGRIEYTIICFWDCLTFTRVTYCAIKWNSFLKGLPGFWLRKFIYFLFILWFEFLT